MAFIKLHKMIYEEHIKITFSGNESIAGILSYPEKIIETRAVLLCSPHPHFAGNMDNNVVKALYKTLSAKGLPVLRFNYRGVGKSAINLPDDLSLFNYWENVEENKKYWKTIEDTESCIQYITSLDGRLKITMIGYSFGAIMAMLTGVDNINVESLICIAPPLLEYDFSILNNCSKLIYFIGSSGDFVYDKEKFLTFCKGMPTLSGSVFYEDCDHFFRGKEEELAQRVWEFMKSQTVQN